MFRFLVRRLILSIPILLLVTIMVFGLIHLIPGDPATVILGQEATPEAKVVMRHALRNALAPVVTSAGLLLAGLLGGLVITETVFAIPGFGRLIVEAIYQRDFVT